MDPDPHYFWKLDPDPGDPFLNEKPDPHKKSKLFRGSVAQFRAVEGL